MPGAQRSRHTSDYKTVEGPLFLTLFLHLERMVHVLKEYIEVQLDGKMHLLYKAKTMVIIQNILTFHKLYGRGNMLQIFSNDGQMRD